MNIHKNARTFPKSRALMMSKLLEQRRPVAVVAEVRFRCRDCGEIVEKRVRPPVPEIGGAVAYIDTA